MAAYHQMAHDSQNLLGDPDVGVFAGAILSPVNYSSDKTKQQVVAHGESGLRMIFDPQLYYPKSQRGQLQDWSYYPQDVDTADVTSLHWWAGVTKDIVADATGVGASAVCSPAVAARTYTPEYYLLCRNVAQNLRDEADGELDVLDTVLVSGRDAADRDKRNQLASVVTGGEADECYLVLVSDVDPRYEVVEPADLAGFAKLITLLEESDMRVLVGFCSTDMILWKAAGATSCASGKYFNVRRFTPSRFDPPSKGGGQLPYWCEESLLAFLRESDVLKVRREDLLSDSSQRNPNTGSIVDAAMASPPGKWLRYSWRQFLWWFQDAERRLGSGETSATQLLVNAQNAWTALESRKVYMEEGKNDGHWIPRWREALRLASSS